MVNRLKQAKLNEIINFLQEHHKVDEWSGEIPQELSLVNAIAKLERFRDEERE